MGLPYNHQVTTKVYPFHLVYGRQVTVPTEFIIPNLFITWDTHMTKDESITKCMDELCELDESGFLEDLHQLVEKER